MLTHMADTVLVLREDSTVGFRKSSENNNIQTLPSPSNPIGSVTIMFSIA